jgi:hypothetical protein
MSDDPTNSNLTLKIFGRCGDESEPVAVELVTREERELARMIEEFIASVLAEEPR